MTEEKKKPELERRIGQVKASVFRFDGEKGPRFSVEFTKFYKRKDGKAWQSTHYFSKHDLPSLERLAAKLFDELYSAE